MFRVQIISGSGIDGSKTLVQLQYPINGGTDLSWTTLESFDSPEEANEYKLNMLGDLAQQGVEDLAFMIRE